MEDVALALQHGDCDGPLFCNSRMACRYDSCPCTLFLGPAWSPKISFICQGDISEDSESALGKNNCLFWLDRPATWAFFSSSAASAPETRLEAISIFLAHPEPLPRRGDFAWLRLAYFSHDASNVEVIADWSPSYSVMQAALD